MAPANPGGGWDQTARAVQHALGAEGILPVPAEVINRGGAGGTIGLAELVGRDDAHTIMVMGRVMLGSILTNHSAVSLRETTPLVRLLDEFEVIAVPKTSRYQTFLELMADFKAAPEKVSWGGGSAGGTDHILVAMLAQAAGVDPKNINYVAYSGGGEAAVAVMGGHVTAGISGYSEWKPHAESGGVRLLAISSDERLGEDSPPAIKESGFDVAISNWRAIVGPRGTDNETRKWLIEALRRMRESATWKETLRRNDWVDSFLTGDDLQAFIEAETESNTAVLKSIGLVSAAATGAQYAAVGPWVVPAVVGIGLIASILWIIVSSVGAVRGARSLKECPPLQQAVDWVAVLATGLLLLAYILLLNPIGYLIATAAFLFAEARVLGSRAWIRDGVFSIVTSALVYTLFNLVLNIGLPAGLLG